MYSDIFFLLIQLSVYLIYDENQLQIYVLSNPGLPFRKQAYPYSVKFKNLNFFLHMIFLQINENIFGHVGTQVRIYRSSALIGCRARRLEWDISSDETAKTIQLKKI